MPNTRALVSSREKSEPGYQEYPQSDMFDEDLSNQVALSDFNSVAKRKYFSKEGGVAYVLRPVEPTKVNTYVFKILKSKKCDLWFGIEREEPLHTWVYRCADGTLSQSGQEPTKFTDM